jgi:hypothetical protein
LLSPSDGESTNNSSCRSGTDEAMGPAFQTLASLLSSSPSFSFLFRVSASSPLSPHTQPHPSYLPDQAIPDLWPDPSRRTSQLNLSSRVYFCLALVRIPAPRHHLCILYFRWSSCHSLSDVPLCREQFEQFIISSSTFPFTPHETFSSYLHCRARSRLYTTPSQQIEPSDWPDLNNLEQLVPLARRYRCNSTPAPRVETLVHCRRRTHTHTLSEFDRFNYLHCRIAPLITPHR